MNYIIKNTKSWVEYMVVAWWMHLVPHLKGRVLIVGSFNHDAIEYITQYCDELYVFGNNVHSSNNKVTNITCDQFAGLKFNAIIVDAIKDPVIFQEENIISLINNNLCTDGDVCFLEENYYSIKSRTSSLVKKIINVFYDCRCHSLSKKISNATIKKLPTIYYDNEPYESFSEGSYFSNKNTFLIKEKFRSFLFNSRLSRLFVSSNIWLINKNAKSKFFHDGLLEFITNQLPENNKKYVIASILYKRGKLIFTYIHTRKRSKTLIVIVTYEEEAYSQRVNEKKSIEYLAKTPSISKYVPHDYFEFKYFGYNIFTMEGSKGITVDALAKDIKDMTLSIFDVLLELVNGTLKKDKTILNVIPNWFSILNARSPNDIKSHNIILDYVSDLDLELSVFMHGDAKIENFVLDKKHNVSGVIDWEQSMINGYPLIDLYYLIVYNYQIKYGCDFSQAFAALVNSRIECYENKMIEIYCSKLKLNEKQKSRLLILFFVHHYSCRFHSNYKDSYDYENYKISLETVLNYIDGDEL